MSGADEKESQEQLIAKIKTEYPMDSEEIFVASDTWGALFSATPSGRKPCNSGYFCSKTSLKGHP